MGAVVVVVVLGRLTGDWEPTYIVGPRNGINHPDFHASPVPSAATYSHSPEHCLLHYLSTITEGIACISDMCLCLSSDYFEAIPKCQGSGSWAWVASSSAVRHKKI